MWSLRPHPTTCVCDHYDTWQGPPTNERTGETKEKWRKEEGHFSLNMRPYHEAGKVARLRRMFLSLSMVDLKGTERVSEKDC